MKKTQKQLEKEFEDWLTIKVKEYSNLLNLNHWEIEVRHNKNLGENVGMSTKFAGSAYLQATIDWGDLVFSFWKDKNYKTLETDVIHELIHILLYPLSTLSYARFTTKPEVEEKIESTCDHLSIALHRILNK
ncbi:hypothetical protein LCGC14_2532410 [marine sediment metagenome]|uniref:SprT-like domain-containing protein n=1 Tax=marine sediment metagenome TaxID=412755 RepID=A0A0F9BG23_9ZZZZ